jgi:HEAT repeat protein
MSEADDAARADALAAAIEEARGHREPAEAAMRLERLADLCAQVAGPKMADALIRILDDDEPTVRVAAGEALLDVGYERYAEVARAIERALDRNTTGMAMTELPFVIAEIGEPSALALLRRFLSHPDADVVAAGVEALVQLGDPGAIADLEKLVDDAREVTLDDLEDGDTTIGELAEAAIEELSLGEGGEGGEGGG